MEGARMPSVVSKIVAWGKRSRLSGDASEILRQAVKKNIRFSDIANSAGCSPQALRYQLKKIGINSLKPKFEERIRAIGYKDLKEFFTGDNAFKTMKELAEGTGFCCPTVSKYYHKFVETLLEKK